MPFKINKNKINLPFGDFLEKLKSQGFIITIDHHFQLQAILKKFGKGRKPSELKYLLCPIFATGEKQQDEFYAAFDSHFKPFDDIVKPCENFQGSCVEIDSEDFQEAAPKKWIYFLGIVLFLGLLFTGIWIDKKNSEKTQEVAGNMDNKIEIQTSTSVEKFIPKTETQSQTIIIPLKKEKIESNFFQFFKDHLAAIRYLLVSALLVFLLIELYRYNNKKMTLQKQSSKDPPFTYPIRVDPQEPRFIKTQNFYTTTRFLRKRMQSDIYRIDIQKTIDQSIKKSGFPEFHYRALTKPPEYLIFINLPAFKDHYAHFINEVTNQIKKEDIFVTRYFYRDDPQICFREVDGKREYLSDICDAYRGYRFILMGTGDDLLDPITGELEQGEDVFEFWTERAILTPREPKDWGYKETALARDFVILPATLDGFEALVDHFEAPPDFDVKDWQSMNSQWLIPENLNDLNELRNYLGDEDSFQWLCACAVYPELHWNLTLYLGAKILNDPLTEYSLLRMIRLPWFREGSIPENVRLLLINKLDKKKKAIVHEAIIDMLEKNPPPEKSAAFDTYRLNLSIQRWMLYPKDPKKRKEILDTVVNEKQIMKDYTLLRVLDSIPASPLNIILPKRFRKIFFRNALPFLGMKAGARILSAFFISLLLIFISISPDLLNLFSEKKLPPTFIIEKTEIHANESFVIMAENNPAKQKIPLQIRWDRDVLFLAEPEKNEFSWQFVPEKFKLTQENLKPGKHSIEISFDKEMFSEPLVLTLKEKILIASQTKEIEKVIPKKEQLIKVKKNSLGMTFVKIPAGTFMMGSPSDEPGRYYDENQHKVTLTKAFYMQTTEVTQGQWKAVMGNNPFSFKNCGDVCPVESVSWNDVQDFIKKLNQMGEGRYRLPTEAEWEYAARAGSTTAFANGKITELECGYDSNLDKMGWYCGNSCVDYSGGEEYSWFEKKCKAGTHPVAQKQPNKWGLYDMHGNVWEWCQDWYEKYQTSSFTDPIGPKNGSYRVNRGGGFASNARYCRSADRDWYLPGNAGRDLGFRLVFLVQQK